MRGAGPSVCVIGGGVVGASVALALARRGVAVTLLEAEDALCLGASGTNSGLLHTGFDSAPGELETRLILRSAKIRDELLDGLAVPVLRTGARLLPRDEAERAAVAKLERNARANGVTTEVAADGSLVVPGESVTDPVAFTLALAAAAERAGARVETSARIEAVQEGSGELALLAGGGEQLWSGATAVNCAGLHADDVAHAAGDRELRIMPRKGEFVVFAAPAGLQLDEVLLPVPSGRTKGVLVFPTVDGDIVAGPTAHDQRDKNDWAVSPEAVEELTARAVERVPALEHARVIGSYAGLRPAGVGVNYVIERSPACPRLVHAAAIRSTGVSAAPAIAERVCELVSETGVVLGRPAPLERGEPPPHSRPWWRYAAERRRERPEL